MTRYEQIKADPVKYAKHLANAKKWQRNNPDKVLASVRKWRRKPDVRERYNERARERYATDVGKRVQMAGYAAKYRSTPAGLMAQRVRSATFLVREGRKGRYWEMFNEMSGKPGHYEGLVGEHADHIIPLVKFDLTDPIQLLKAVHWTNVRGIGGKENMEKGDECGEFDMESLPYNGSADALFFAEAFIRKVKQSLAGVNRPLEADYESRGCTVGDTGTPEGRVVGAEEGQEEMEEGASGSEHSGVPEVSGSVPGEGAGVPAEVPEGVEG